MITSTAPGAMIVTLEVEVQRAVEDPAIPSSGQLLTWAQAAWLPRSADAQLVIRICDEAESRQLNHEFRGKDQPTNVLSFPYEPVPEIGLDHVGDLLICAPVVAREATQQGKTIDAHWAHMVVHGVLHLQGHDHQDDAQAEAMETIETRILGDLGFPAPYTDEAKT